jgi:phytoene desaturase
VTSGSVVVIGAGPGGLAAAMLLAASGVAVTVLERGPRVGGRCSRIELDGYRFDAGPTFFLYPRIIEELFQSCGFDFRREVEMLRLDPLYRLSFMREDGAMDHLRLWSDPQQLAAAVAAFSPHDAAGLRQFMLDNRAKLAAFEPVLSRPFSGITDFLDPQILKALRHLRPWASVDRELSRYFRDPRLRLAFSFQSKYLGMSPFRCPSLFTILSFLEHEHGVWHPVGGCNSVIDVMARLARSMGVRIELGQAVEEILFEGRKAVGVRTAGGVQRADAVVVNADFAQAMQDLVPDALRSRWTDAKLATKRYSCSTFMLYLGIEGAVDLDHHTVVLAEKYADNLREIECGSAPPSTPSVYVQNASVSDSTLAPRGHSSLYVLVPVGNLERGIDWTRERARFRALVFERLAAMGIDDLERRIRVERIVTPQEWSSEHAVFRGATFNLAHSLDQMLCWRPNNRFEDLERVYLVGGGTHPGSGLPVIFEGARITARLMADDLGFKAVAPPQASALTPHAGAALMGACE